MKTTRLLLYTVAGANALFFAFHLFLGWQIHRLQLDPALRALMEMLNGGGALSILLIAVTAIVLVREDRPSLSGQLVLGFGAVMYLTRGAAEFIVTPVFHPLIFGICVLGGGLHAWTVFHRGRQPSSGPPAERPLAMASS